MLRVACMETAVHYHNASAFLLTHNHLAKRFDAPTHVAFAMRLPPDADLALKRISASIAFNKRFQDSRVVRFNHMATRGSQGSIKEENIEKKEEAKQESKELPPPPPPPPPEKPEPGDCCGSGCVRCVWDVYYEDLEEYNKLYKSDSTDSKSD